MPTHMHSYKYIRSGKILFVARKMQCWEITAEHVLTVNMQVCVYV